MSSETPAAAPAAAGSEVVVIAVDGSAQSDEAFMWYMQHVHRVGNTVLLVHGMEMGSMPTRDNWDSQMTSGKKKQDELQAKYTAKFKELEVTGKFISDFEKPGEFICDVAKKNNASYVCMGTRGLGKFRRTIMGSVSDYVVHHAPCPVLVCRQK